MAEKERSFGNRFWNTIRIPQRVIGTAWLLWADAVKTTTWVLEDFWGVVDSTTNKIVGLFSKDKKWYQKILNVPVAAWVGLVWAVEAVVKPVVNWLNNTWKTAVNAVTNAWKSTFGSLFSAKPVSDISFNTLKTKKWVVHLDTQKRTLDPSKPWTINRWNWSNDKKKTVTKTAAVAWAATAAAVVWEKEIANIKKELEDKMNATLNAKLNEMKEEYDQELKKVLNSKQELEKQNDVLQKANDAKDKEIAKLKAEIEWLKNGSDSPAEVKPEKKEEKPAEAKSEKKEEKLKEDKSEKKESEWKAEKKEEKAPEKSEIKDSERILELIESGNWKKMIDYLKSNHPEINIETDKSTVNWKLYWPKSWNKIIVGCKNRKEVPQILLHEISHILINDNVEGVDNLLDIIWTIYKYNGKQLSMVACNDKKYPTLEDKKIEDACELIALYARWDWSFDKYMSELQSWKNEKLAKIDETDADYLKNLCEDILDFLDED